MRNYLQVHFNSFSNKAGYTAQGATKQLFPPSLRWHYGPMDGPMDGPIDGPKDGWTDGQSLIKWCFIAPKK